MNSEKSWQRFIKEKVILEDGSVLTIQNLIGSGAYSNVFQTSESKYVVKIMSQDNQECEVLFKKEKLFQKLIKKHENIVQIKECQKCFLGQKGVYLIIYEFCRYGNLFDIIQKMPSLQFNEFQLIKIARDVSKGLFYLHENSVVHRDVKIENILLGGDEDQCYKLCDFGSCVQTKKLVVDSNNRQFIFEDLDANTTPQYRAPEQLDLYSNKVLSEKVDIFALGVVIFILAYQKVPFESKLAAINKQYFVGKENKYSEKLGFFFESVFEGEPEKRFSALQVLQFIEKNYPEIEKSLAGRLNPELLDKASSKIEPNFIDKIKKYYSRLTTKSEGWIVSALQESEVAPKQKYVYSLIEKSWQKRYKAEKILEKIGAQQNKNSQNTIINLKTLVLLHQILYKGPQEILSDKYNVTANKILLKINREWEINYSNNSVAKIDPKRSLYNSQIIFQYSQVLLAKIKTNKKYLPFIEGNFNLQPYFQKQKASIQTEIPVEILHDLCFYLKQVMAFFEILVNQYSLWNIQSSIIALVSDEEYSLISLLTYLITYFKFFCKAEDPQSPFQEKFVQSYQNYQEIFLKLSQQFKNSQIIKDHNLPKNIPTLDNSILEKIINSQEIQIKNEQFNSGFKIPGIYLPQSFGNPYTEKDNFLENEHLFSFKNNRKFSDDSSLNKSTSKEVQFHQNAINQNNVLSNNNQNHNKKAITNTSIIIPRSISVQQSNGNNLAKIEQSKINFQQKSSQHQMSNEQKFSSSTQDDHFSQQFKEYWNQPIDEKSNEEPKQNEKKPQQIQDPFLSFDTKLTFNGKQLDSTSNKFFDLHSPSTPPDVNFNKIISSQEKNVNPNQQKNPVNNFDFNFKDNFTEPQEKQTEKLKTNKIFQNPTNQEYNQLKNEKNQDNQNNTQNDNTTPRSPLIKIKEDTNNITSLKEYANQLKNIQSNQQPLLKQNVIQQQQQQLLQQQINLQKNISQNQKSEQNTLLQQHIQQQTQIKKLNQNQTQINDNQQKSPKKLTDRFVDINDILKNENQPVENWVINYAEIQLLNQIGSGNSSLVYKAVWKGLKVAVKKMKLQNLKGNHFKEIKREIQTLVKLQQHPNLVSLMGVSQKDDEFLIIMDFCAGGTLFDLLHKNTYIALSWNQRLKIMKDIVDGMIYLHSFKPPIIHRDLKSLNILLDKAIQYKSLNNNNYYIEQEVQVKIADFGLSRTNDTDMMTGCLGTFHWMAPEIFDSKPYSTKADIYSFGIVVWEICARQTPYINFKSQQAMMKYITLDNGRPNLKVIPQDCPDAFLILMQKCWAKESDQRPDFNQIQLFLNQVQIE